MSMTLLPAVLNFDDRAWRTATWSAPFIVQFAVAVLLIFMWLLDKSSWVGHSQRTLLLSATAVSTFLFLVIGLSLGRSKSLRRSAFGFSVIASSAVVLLGGIYYAFGVFR